MLHYFIYLFISLIQDVLINSSASGTSGRLYNRIRYLRKIHNSKNAVNGGTGVSLPTPQDVDRPYSMNDLLYLKTVVVSENSMAEIQKKLEVTRHQRDELVRSNKVDFMEHFPFFFAHPQLVGQNLNLPNIFHNFHHL